MTNEISFAVERSGALERNNNLVWMVSIIGSKSFQILVRDSEQPRALAGLSRTLRRSGGARGRTPLELMGGTPPETNAEIPPNPKRERSSRALGKVLQR